MFVNLWLQIGRVEFILCGIASAKFQAFKCNINYLFWLQCVWCLLPNHIVIVWLRKMLCFSSFMQFWGKPFWLFTWRWCCRTKVFAVLLAVINRLNGQAISSHLWVGLIFTNWNMLDGSAIYDWFLEIYLLYSPSLISNQFLFPPTDYLSNFILF